MRCTVTIKSKFKRGAQPSGAGSQFDSQQTLKLGFDDNLESFRFHDSEGPIYDRFETVIDAMGNMTKITYYVANEREKFELGVTADVSGSLNNTYFLISSAYDRVMFYVWYSVDGLGVDPMISGATGIEIPLMANDTANIVATATMGYMNTNSEFAYIFDVSRQNAVLTLNTKKQGPVTTNSTGTTSFVLNTLTEGTEVINEIYSLTYDGCDLTGMYKI